MIFELSFINPPPLKVIIMTESYVSFYGWSYEKHLQGSGKAQEWLYAHRLEYQASAAILRHPQCQLSFCKEQMHQGLRPLRGEWKRNEIEQKQHSITRSWIEKTTSFVQKIYLILWLGSRWVICQLVKMCNLLLWFSQVFSFVTFSLPFLFSFVFSQFHKLFTCNPKVVSKWISERVHFL
jgi:hypothetical protein